MCACDAGTHHAWCFIVVKGVRIGRRRLVKRLDGLAKRRRTSVEHLIVLKRENLNTIQIFFKKKMFGFFTTHRKRLSIGVKHRVVRPELCFSATQ
jgi:hypothetical protein